MGTEEAAHEQAIEKTVSLSKFSCRARLAAPPFVLFDDHPALPLFQRQTSRRPERFLASAQLYGGGAMSTNPADAVGIRRTAGLISGSEGSPIPVVAVSGRLDGLRPGQLCGPCRHSTGQNSGNGPGKGVSMQGFGQRFVSPESESRPQQQATAHLAP